MIEEFGTVVEIKNSIVAVVQCQRNSACQHCPSSGACSMGDDGKTMQVEAVNKVGAGLNDQVKIVTSTKHFLQSSFLLYIVPIIGLLIGALIGQAIAERIELGIEPSLLSAVTAIVFLIATFMAIRVGTQRLQADVFMPRIVEIKERAESQG